MPNEKEAAENAEWRRRALEKLETVPRPTETDLVVGGVNEPVELYTGDLEFSIGSSESSQEQGRLLWKWQPSSGPRFEIETSGSAGSLIDTSSIELGVPGEAAGEGFVTKSNSAGDASGPLRSAEVGAQALVDRLVFHVPNFVDFIGAPLGEREKLEDGGDRVQSRLGRLALSTDRWRVVIDNTSATKDTIDTLKKRGGFAITHVGEIRRAGGEQFTREEASDLLKALGFFLSFMRGFWTQPILLRGFREKKQEGEKLVAWAAQNLQLNAWATPPGWFDRSLAGDMSPLFQKFWDAWLDPASQEVLRKAISWYLEANSGSMLQSRLILEQVALEMMAYEVLTDEQGNEPSGSAASLITRMLGELGIPDHVPADTSHLHALAQQPLLKANPPDPDLNGPGVTAAIRNALVHSKRAKRQKRSSLEGEHYVEAWQLSQWHLELSLLAWIGYEGEYSRRWRSNAWKGETEPVPWTVQAPVFLNKTVSGHVSQKHSKDIY
jgi:hypothetical protein